MLKKFQSSKQSPFLKNAVKFCITGLFSMLLSCTDSSENTAPKFTESKVTLPTHQLTAYSVIKNSKYLVVFESGLGDDHTPWNQTNVANQIAKASDVLLYDRAGYGKSDQNTSPRNIDKLRSELEQVINMFANGRKVVLVGHSLGGLIIRDYAIKNPTKTAALLFVDPTHELYNAPTQEMEDYMFDLFNNQYGTAFGGTQEIGQLIEDLAYSALLPNLPNVPVTVLSSMKHDANNDAADELYGKTRQDWYNAHETLKNGLSDFKHIGTSNSGHYIMLNEPALVIDTINELLSKLP